MEIRLINSCCSSRCDFGVDNDTRDDGRRSGVRVYTCWLMIWLSNTFGRGTVQIKNDQGTFVHVSRDSLNKWLARQGKPDVVGFDAEQYENAILSVVNSRTPVTASAPIQTLAYDPNKQYSLDDALRINPSNCPSVVAILNSKARKEIIEAFPDFEKIVAAVDSPTRVSEIEGQIRDPRILIFIGMVYSTKYENCRVACEYYLAAAKRSPIAANATLIQFNVLGDQDNPVRYYFRAKVYEIIGSDAMLVEAIRAYNLAKTRDKDCPRDIPSILDIAKRIKDRKEQINAYMSMANIYKRENVKKGENVTLQKECLGILVDRLQYKRAHYELGMLEIPEVGDRNVKAALKHFLEVVNDPEADIDSHEFFDSMLHIMRLDRNMALDRLSELIESSKKVGYIGDVLNKIENSPELLWELAKIPEDEQHPLAQNTELRTYISLACPRVYLRQNRAVAAAEAYIAAAARSIALQDEDFENIRRLIKTLHSWGNQEQIVEQLQAILPAS